MRSIMTAVPGLVMLSRDNTRRRARVWHKCENSACLYLGCLTWLNRLFIARNKDAPVFSNKWCRSSAQIPVGNKGPSQNGKGWPGAATHIQHESGLVESRRMPVSQQRSCHLDAAEEVHASTCGEFGPHCRWTSTVYKRNDCISPFPLHSQPYCGETRCEDIAINRSLCLM